MKGVPEVTAAELEHEIQKQVDSKTLLKEGKRTVPGYRHQVWEKVRKTPREKSLVKTYKDATHVWLNKDMKRMGLKGMSFRPTRDLLKANEGEAIIQAKKT